MDQSALLILSQTIFDLTDEVSVDVPDVSTNTHVLVDHKTVDHYHRQRIHMIKLSNDLKPMHRTLRC